MTLEEKAKFVIEKRKEYKKYVPETTAEVSQYIIESILDYIDNKTELKEFDSNVFYVQFFEKSVTINACYEFGALKEIMPERYLDLDEKAIKRVFFEVKRFFKEQEGYTAEEFGERVFRIPSLKISIEE